MHTGLNPPGNSMKFTLTSCPRPEKKGSFPAWPRATQLPPFVPRLSPLQPVAFNPGTGLMQRPRPASEAPTTRGPGTLGRVSSLPLSSVSPPVKRAQPLHSARMLKGFRGLVPSRHQVPPQQGGMGERGVIPPVQQGPSWLQGPHLALESLIRAVLLWEQGFLQDFSFHQQRHRNPESQAHRSPQEPGD